MEQRGKTAVITGAARGIGFGIALELAARGARVVLVARSEDALREARERIRATGGEAEALAVDITEADWFGQLDAFAPQVDVLVNNAAAFASYGPVEEVALAEIERVLEVGVDAALRLTRHVLPGMKGRGYGRVIQIGSVAGSVGGAGQVAYSTAKAALQGLTRAVAIESARRGVTCNMLELGLVDTERTTHAISDEIRGCLVRNTPVGRPGTIAEVAHAAAFLASPTAGFVTGATLPVSGGLGLGLYPEQLG